MDADAAVRSPLTLDVLRVSSISSDAVAAGAPASGGGAAVAGNGGPTDGRLQAQEQLFERHLNWWKQRNAVHLQ